MRGAEAVVQGKKGTAADKVQLAFRCPIPLHEKLEATMGPGGVLTARVLDGLQESVDIREGAGARLRELQAAAILEGKTFGQLVAELALEALDHRKGKKR